MNTTVAEQMNNQALSLLLVEADPGVADRIAAMLADSTLRAPGAAAFRVVRAECLSQALALLQTNAFSIALLDLSLPDARGIVGVDRIRAAAPDLPLIVLGGQNDGTLARRAVQQGAQDYLVKEQLDGHWLLHAICHALERKRIERACRASERRYRALLAHSVEAICLCDPDQRTLVEVNPAFVELLGYDRDELDGLTIDAIMAPEGMDIDGFLERTHTLGALPPSPQQWRRKGGTFVEVEVTASEIQIDGRQEILVIARDISDRRRREREREAVLAVAYALRSVHTRTEMLPILLEQVRELLRATGAAFATRDTRTGETVVELAIGHTGRKATGKRFPPGESISGHVIETGQPYHNANVYSDLQFAGIDLAPGGSAVACVPLILEDETLGALWVTRATPLGEDELHLLTAVADMAANGLQRVTLLETLEQRVAERTRALASANQRLTELDRLKSNFVANVTHELRTPITNLKFYLNLLTTGKAEKQALYLDFLENEVAHLAQLVKDVLFLSSLERSKASPSPISTDLNLLVEQVVSVHRPRAAALGLRLIFAPAEKLPPVSGDPILLKQLFRNLLANAMNYTEQGSIEVGTGTDGRSVRLQVQDEGIGIADEDLPHIFERFYRGHNATEVRAPGTGLGLSIVKEIVHLLDGRIEIESKLGKGTVVRVWLPTTPNAAQHKP